MRAKPLLIGLLIAVSIGAAWYLNHREAVPHEAKAHEPGDGPNVSSSISTSPITLGPRPVTHFAPAPSHDASSLPYYEREMSLVSEANEALENENYARAVSASQECLGIDPASRECFHSELLGYTRSGDFANARYLLDECLFVSPDDVDCISGMITQDVRAGDLTSARTLAGRLRVLAPDTAQMWLADAVIAERAGDATAAIAAYERACTAGQEFACFRAQALRRSAD